jgi:hypothetical protein
MQRRAICLTVTLPRPLWSHTHTHTRRELVAANHDAVIVLQLRHGSK